MQSSRVRFNQWYKKSANKASVLKRMKEYYQKNKGKITKKRESRKENQDHLKLLPITKDITKEISN